MGFSPLTGDPMAAPVAESQNLMVSSQLHDTMVLPAGSKQTPVTRSVWPVREHICSFVCVLKTTTLFLGA